MVAADTTRTKYYLNELIRNGLVPNYVLLLLNARKELLPGQTEAVGENALVSLLTSHGVKYGLAQSSDINSESVVSELSVRPEKVLIYSGYGGVLLKENLLSIEKKFLHIHGGYLPDFKGSTTNYYSLINENTIGASAIFLTKEIDCGPILLRKKFPPPTDRKEIDHKYDAEVRASVLIECVQNYLHKGEWICELSNNNGGETFYIIHPVLKHLAIMSEREPECE
jgi:methionyl-tRNA formyltransferase